MTLSTDEGWRDGGLAARVAGIETRVGKLETALAERPAADETAISDRVIARLSELAAESRAVAVADRVVVLDATTGQPLAMPPPADPPDGAVIEPPPAIPATAAKRGWFLAQIWYEFRLVFRMYFDPRYRISRTTQFVIPAIGLALVFNYFLFSIWLAIPVLSPVLERVLAIVLAVVAWIVLSREVGRYRDVLEYLAKYGR